MLRQTLISAILSSIKVTAWCAAVVSALVAISYCIGAGKIMTVIRCVVINVSFIDP